MSRQKITIPAAGEEKRISMTGLSVIVEFGKLYETPEDVPSLSFNSGTTVKPLYPRSTYNFNGKKIDSVVIKGTAESEGDEFYLLSSENCLEEVIRVEFERSYSTIPGTTFTKISNNSVQQLTEIELINSDGLLPKRVDVSVSPGVDAGGIKWALNADPVQGDDTLGTVLKSGEYGTSGLIQVPGNTIFAFRFISETGGENRTVNFTPYY